METSIRLWSGSRKYSDTMGPTAPVRSTGPSSIVTPHSCQQMKIKTTIRQNRLQKQKSILHVLLWSERWICYVLDGPLDEQQLFPRESSWWDKDQLSLVQDYWLLAQTLSQPRVGWVSARQSSEPYGFPKMQSRVKMYFRIKLIIAYDDNYNWFVV